jgi:DNA polymerase-3 subunit beta
MKFSVDKAIFLKNLFYVVGIVDNRSSMLILSHVLIEAKGEKIYLTATDLESSVYTSFPAKITDEGSICVPGKKFFDVVDKLPDNDAQYQITENAQLEVVFNKGKTKIKTLPGDDFPQIPKPEDFIFRTIKSETLSNLINKTSYCVSNDEMRKNLTGVYFDMSNPGKIKAISTDGHRMSLVEEELENSIIEAFILPKKATNEIKKFIKESDVLNIGVGKSFFVCDNGQTSILSRLIDVKFPDYSQVVPNNFIKSFKVKKNDLISALQRISVVLSEKAKGAKITVNQNNLEIRSLSETGESVESVETVGENQNIEIGFNVKYLIEALNSFENEQLNISINDEVSPACIYVDEKHKDFQLAIIMPMRV